MAKTFFKKVTILTSMRIQRNWNTHTLLMETKIAEPLWKNLVVSSKSKHALTIQPSNYTSGHLSQRNKHSYLYTQNPLYTNVYCSIICCNGWMVTLWYTYINGTLLSNRKEWTIDTCHNEDYADWINLIPKIIHQKIPFIKNV